MNRYLALTFSAMFFLLTAVSGYCAHITLEAYPYETLQTLSDDARTNV